MRVVHIITGLEVGGAELSLYKLLASGLFDKQSTWVISLAEGGAVANKIRALGITVETIGMKRGNFSLNGWIKLRARLLQLQPDLVQTWMYHSDVLGGTAARAAGIRKVLWNVRNGSIDISQMKISTLLTIFLSGCFSHIIPDVIISCSYASQRVHRSLTYPKNKFVLIPNGFDLQEFVPDPTAHSRLCNEIGISENSRIIGIVARFDPQKDHRTFLAAAKITTQSVNNLHFVMVGPEIDSHNKVLLGIIEEYGLKDKTHLLGIRTDIPYLMAAFDLLTLSSRYGEGFPNVLGEAMACETPCVATDVGDAAFVLRDTGLIVPPRDPSSLAQAWMRLLSMPQKGLVRLGHKARARIVEKFTLFGVAKTYASLYQDLVQAKQT